MKKPSLLSLILMLLLMLGCGSAKNVTSKMLTADKTPIITTIDLVNIKEDKVQVVIDPGVFTTDEVLFYIPKTVPGTYTSDNYGQYVEGFVAIDYNGEELVVRKKDVNTWSISNGKNVDKVVYFVNDTYDSEGEVEKAVFSPAGTNIKSGDNFMLNLHSFVGYFKDLKEVPYELKIMVPNKLKATTSLIQKGGDKQQVGIDTFYAKRYFDVIDNPILYAKSNTESFQINDFTVTLSVYSPNNVYTAASLMGRMEKMMRAQKAFLGEGNHTREYNILLYLSAADGADASGFGALEHHTSTVVVLPEAIPRERMEQAMVDVVSHEFFHIVTPLNVHSKEVQYFDFNNPKMSQHLWMYEGTTEYFANLFQIQEGLINEVEFYERILKKIDRAKNFDDTMSFTQMSKHILDDEFKDSYANVYEKGALINMSLDILLNELSGGEKTVLWLMRELSKEYDEDSPFEDDNLIDEIVALTYPEIQEFFDAHVIGTTPIDYNVILSKVGLTTAMVEKQTGYFLDGDIPFIDVDQANGNAIFVRKGIELNSFFKDLGLQAGDVLQEINGTPMSIETIRPLIGQSFGWFADTEISMKVKRGEEELEVKGKVGVPMLNVTAITSLENLSDAQKALKEFWLN